MNRRYAPLAAVTLLAASPALAACGSSSGSSSSFGASSTSSAASGSSSLPTAKLMVGGIDKQIYLPYKLAEQLGFYKKYGVNVILSTEAAGGVGAEDAMVAGNVDMAGAWYNHTIQLQDKGKAIESVIQLSGAPGERIMCSTKSGVHSGADLKGKRMGVTDLGSGTDVLTQYIAAKAGVTKKQYTTVAVGAGSTAIAALQHGSVDCEMTTQPTVQAIENKGIGYSAVDLATVSGATAAVGAGWPAAGVIARTDWVNANKDTVQKVVNALVATMAWIHTHNATDIANALPQSYVQNPLVSKADYIKALTQDYGQFLPDGLMPANGPKSVLDSLVLVGKATGKENLITTFTNDFVNEAHKTQ